MKNLLAQKLNLKFEFMQITLLLSLPIFLPYTLYQVIPIQNQNAISITSVVALLNEVLWILIILQIFTNYYFIQKFSLKVIIKINLLMLLIYVSSFKVLIKALALKGTPLPGADIRGDLLVLYNLAKVAENQYWPGSIYPPLWPSVIGNLARILNVNVLSLFKPGEMFILILAPILIFYTWRLILNPWIAYIISISQSLLVNLDYKSLTLNLVLPMVIFVVIKINNQSEVERLKLFLLGLSIGFLSLLYFGYIYWLIPMLILAAIGVFFAKDQNKFLTSNTYTYLGLAVGLGPAIYEMLTESFYIYYLIIFGIYLILLISDKFEFIKNFLQIFINITILVSLLIGFIIYRSKDTWFYGDIERNDPTVKPLLNLSGTNLVSFLLIIVVFYLLIILKQNIALILILAAIYLSSTIFMYLIASQMQITNRVDLWPRAIEVQAYARDLIFLLLILFLIEGLIAKQEFAKYWNLGHKNLFFLIAFVLFFVGSFLVGSLGSFAHSNMPYHGPNVSWAWYAHQGCSNPHEDPMLSKVFENYPDVQDFLRTNCSSVNWPAIPKLN